jgi:hypothetical protein
MEHDVDTDLMVMFVLGFDTDFNSMVRLAFGTDGLGYQNARFASGNIVLTLANFNYKMS